MFYSLFTAHYSLKKDFRLIIRFKSKVFCKIDVGNELSSQEVALQVFSPLRVFTTVFGMGTGGFLLLGHQQACVWFFSSFTSEPFSALVVHSKSHKI